MTPSLISILVVDDHEPWRQKICSILQTRPELRVVAQVEDGVAAVQAAEELKPDLILLDIGLPRLNGIQAARQIQQVSPNSKILFLSENRSRDIAEEALRTGGVCLLDQVECGKRTVACDRGGFAGEAVRHSLFGWASSHCFETRHIADARDRQKSVAPLPPVNVRIRHEVEFYADDAGIVDQFARLTKDRFRGWKYGRSSRN